MIDHRRRLHRSPASAARRRSRPTSARSSVVVLGLLLAAHLAVRRLAPGADGMLLPLAALLNGLGYVFIARLRASQHLAGAAGDVDGRSASPRSSPRCSSSGASRDLERYRYTFALLGIGLLCCRCARHRARRSTAPASGCGSGRSASSPASSPRSSWPSSSPPTWSRSASCSAWRRGRGSARSLPDPKHLGPVLAGLGRRRSWSWSPRRTSARRCCSSPCSS